MWGNMIGIYQIRNMVTGRVYIGSSLNIEKRWKNHIYRLRNNSHDNRYLQNSWNKHSASNFEFSVLEHVEDREKLIMVEQKHLDTVNKKYNINTIAGRPPSREGVSFSLEQREEISRRVSGKNNPFYGKEHTKESKEKMSENSKGEKHPSYGKKMSEETKQKIREARVGKYCGERHSQWGTTKSEETKEKISLSNLGKTRDAKTREKISNSVRMRSPLDWSDVCEIREEYAKGKTSQRVLGELYGVARTTIQGIVENRIWKEIK